MTSAKQDKHTRRADRLLRDAEAARRAHVRRLRTRVGLVSAAALLVLGGVFALSTAGTRSASDPAAARYRFVVARPGLGARAPELRLASTTGGTWDLAAQRGRATLLYFQEGLGCQPCWEQIKDIEGNPQRLKALGVDEVVSITGNDLGQLKQKAADEGIHTRVLADPGLTQSRRWGANEQGMMGDTANGHSFVLVDPQGTIRARADYGGAPDYTMYLPVDSLARDLHQQLTGHEGA